jgi:hypothetical protein
MGSKRLAEPTASLSGHSERLSAVFITSRPIGKGGSEPLSMAAITQSPLLESLQSLVVQDNKKKRHQAKKLVFVAKKLLDTFHNL